MNEKKYPTLKFYINLKLRERETLKGLTFTFSLNPRFCDVTEEM